MKNIYSLLFLTACIISCSPKKIQQKDNSASDSVTELLCGSNMLHPPFSSLDEAGNPVGIEVEIVTAAAQELGYKVVWVQMDFGGLLPAVEKGELALAVSTIGITEKRKKSVLFSEPYYETSIAAFMREGENVATLDELKDKKIMADEGTTSYLAAVSQWPENEIMDKADDEVWPELLANGEIDVFIVDASDQPRIESQHGIKLSKVEEPLSVEFFGIAINKANVELKEAIDKVIAWRLTESN